MSGKYCCVITQREFEKCRNDCKVFKGTDCISKKLDFILQFKGEAKRFNYEIDKYF